MLCLIILFQLQQKSIVFFLCNLKKEMVLFYGLKTIEQLTKNYLLFTI